MVGEVGLVTVGQIERPFGVRGEVKVRSLTDVPGRFEALARVNLVARSGMTIETNVIHVRRVGRGFIMGLADVTTPEAAEPWRGGFIQAPRGIVPPLPAGTYYACDLIGLAVQTDQEQPLGVLEQVWELPGHHVFVVRHGAEEVLIPAAKEWVPAVDLERRVMTVHVMDTSGEGHAAV
jgi:16S rRNA processing protein RimM